MKKMAVPLMLCLVILSSLLTFGQAQGPFCTVTEHFPGKCPSENLGCFIEMSGKYGASSMLHGCHCTQFTSDHTCACQAVCSPPL
uniref:Uncharacterized protein n=1 Tax=Vitis vinifera TaxID=29760 RepID=A5BEE3_VITVI|nr:hypothetical protein VITISV_026404 [Vitis vinifera]